MPLCYNTTNEVQSPKIFGEYYTIKPGKMRHLSDRVAHFIQTERRETGIVILPVEFEDPSYLETEEGKQALKAKQAEGLKHYIDYLRRIVANNQVSLRRDLERSNIKADPAVFASEGEIAAMELLAQYQISEKDESQKKADRVKELMDKITKE